MTDDLVVVELLIRLKQSRAASASLSPKSYPLPFTWGLKQPRSRLTTFSRRKDADSTRCSPTTPLSWSGGASPSVTADGYEDSSRPSVVSHQASRSKVISLSLYHSLPLSISSLLYLPVSRSGSPAFFLSPDLYSVVSQNYLV